MAVVTLVLYAVWLATGFGIRAILQVRRTGDTGFRAAGGGPASARWWAALLLATALVSGVAAPIADLAGLGTLPGTRTAAVQGIGAVFAVLGIAGNFLAQVAMGDSWRIGVDEGERTELVTGGPFRLVRNPIYTMTGVTAAGLALMVPNVIALVAFAGVLVVTEVQVRVVEEPYLAQVHGAAFTAYAATAGRFLPGVGRLG